VKRLAATSWYHYPIR